LAASTETCSNCFFLSGAAPGFGKWKQSTIAYRLHRLFLVGTLSCPCSRHSGCFSAGTQAGCEARSCVPCEEACYPSHPPSPPDSDRLEEMDYSETASDISDYDFSRKPGSTDQEYLDSLHTSCGHICLLCSMAVTTSCPSGALNMRSLPATTECVRAISILELQMAESRLSCRSESLPIKVVRFIRHHFKVGFALKEVQSNHSPLAQVNSRSISATDLRIAIYSGSQEAFLT